MCLIVGRYCFRSKVYDKGGVELAYQSYSDTIPVKRDMFNEYQDGIMRVVDYAYNPHLSNYANSKGGYPHADVIGNNSRFVRKISKKQWIIHR